MSDPLQNAFEKSQDKMNITEGTSMKLYIDILKTDTSELTFKDEANKFKKAFEDPEFRKLFADYMDEMQDPKHRQETEDYITQLEGEQKVPTGKQLIR